MWGRVRIANHQRLSYKNHSRFASGVMSLSRGSTQLGAGQAVPTIPVEIDSCLAQRFGKTSLQILAHCAGKDPGTGCHQNRILCAVNTSTAEAPRHDRYCLND